MKTCPENADPLTCGIEAAEFLIEGEHISFERRGRGLPIIVDEFGKVALNETLKFHFGNANGDDINMNFKCLTCGRFIRMSNEFTSLYAEILED
jgi:hypothetical protein